jgi:hypothetical protein
MRFIIQQTAGRTRRVAYSSLGFPGQLDAKLGEFHAAFFQHIQDTPKRSHISRRIAPTILLYAPNRAFVNLRKLRKFGSGYFQQHPCGDDLN